MTKNMAELSLLAFRVKDSTGSIRVSLWGEKAEKVHLNVGDVIAIEEGEGSAYQINPCVNTQMFSTVTVSFFIIHLHHIHY